MAFAPEKAIQPLRKLRKKMKAAPKRPSPRQVHTLRTQSRRVEAVVRAFRLNHRKAGKRLLQAIEPVRKKAGKVRDMDVLIGFVTTLSEDGEDQCVVQLIEHLGSLRAHSARKLRKTIAAEQEEVRLRLKQCSKLVKKQSKTSGNRAAEREWSADSTAIALEIWTDICAWPRLKVSNLHPFRLKIKELRYLLQLTNNDTGKFLRALGDVKDKIGEWHDWSELVAIEADALDHGTQCSLKRKIRRTTKTKLEAALSAANAMREKYQSGNNGRDRILNDPPPSSSRIMD